MKLIAQNKQARREFEFIELFEVGIILQGNEVKALREGKVSLQEAYVRPIKGELWLVNMHIPQYRFDSAVVYDARRPRKLLLHATEIRRLVKAVEQKGLTITIVKLYFERGLAKAEIALARGKKIYDKREDMKKQDAEREARQRDKNRD